MRMLALLVAAAGLAPTSSAQTPLALEVVVTGLPRPVQVAAPPGDLDRLFVVQQTGQIRIVRDGQLLPQPFLDATQTPGPGFLQNGECGLLGLAFHPQFDQNGQLFVYCCRQPSIQVAVERYTVSAGNPDVCDPASRVEVFTTSMVFGNHNAGGIAFGPDGYLYVPIGDGGSTGPLWPTDPFNHAQRGDSFLGKILRLDVDNPQNGNAYGIPPGNPFVGVANWHDEIWDFGLRNPYRCTFDRLTGDYWIADVGGRREEVDFEPAGSLGGRNYGWSCMSGTFCNGNGNCVCNGVDLTAPLHEYFPPSGGRAIIGGYVYRGCAVPDLRGSYLFADYVFGSVWSLQHNGQTVTQVLDRTAELTAPQPWSLDSPCGFGEDGRGELYICNLSGQVFRIVPATPTLVGVTPFGVGTSGCNGPHALAADCTPVVGDLAFGLRSSNAPPSALGLLAFANGADVAGSDLLGVGLLVHVDPFAGFFVIVAMASDAGGVGRYALPIPPTAALAGMQLHAQAIWGWSPAQCTPSAIGWSSSAGLSFTIQP
jgi:glucose/arabinose dehydrogenase